MSVISNSAIFTRLMLGGVLISIIAGTYTYIHERHEMDQYLTGLITNEAYILTKYYRKYHHSPSATTLNPLRDSINHSLGHDVFISIEFFNESLTNVASDTLRDFGINISELNQRFSPFEMQGKIEDQMLYFNDELYVKIMTPIREPLTANIIGHLEGIYHVSSSKLREIQNNIIGSVIQSILTVLFTSVLLFPVLLQLKKSLFKRSNDLIESNFDTIKSLGSAISKRDDDTSAHNYRVTLYSVALAEAWGLEKQALRALIKGAFLHDVGKIGISDNILLKSGKLTRQEYDLMKQHVVIGSDIVAGCKWLEDAVDVIQYHHEKFDGSGYPFQLKSQAIPIVARIFAIVDVFDALVSERPYKQAFSLTQALDTLRQESGSHFDPDILTCFLQIANKTYADIICMQRENRLNDRLDDIMHTHFITN